MCRFEKHSKHHFSCQTVFIVVQNFLVYKMYALQWAYLHYAWSLEVSRKKRSWRYKSQSNFHLTSSVAILSFDPNLEQRYLKRLVYSSDFAQCQCYKTPLSHPIYLSQEICEMKKHYYVWKHKLGFNALLELIGIPKHQSRSYMKASEDQRLNEFIDLNRSQKRWLLIEIIWITNVESSTCRSIVRISPAI